MLSDCAKNVIWTWKRVFTSYYNFFSLVFFCRLICSSCPRFKFCMISLLWWVTIDVTDPLSLLVMTLVHQVWFRLSPLKAPEAQTFGQGLLPWPVFSGAVWFGGAQSPLRQRLSSVPRCHCHSCYCAPEGKREIWGIETTITLSQTYFSVTIVFFLSQFGEDMYRLYGNRAVVEVVTVKTFEAPLTRKSRSILQSKQIVSLKGAKLKLLIKCFIICVLWQQKCSVFIKKKTLNNL